MVETMATRTRENEGDGEEGGGGGDNKEVTNCMEEML